MDQFKSFLPKNKYVECLDDVRNLALKELKTILVAYKEELSGSKADLNLKAFAILSRIKRQEEGDLCLMTRFKPPSDEHCTYDDIIKNKCSHLPWASDLKGNQFFLWCSYMIILYSERRSWSTSN